MSDDFPPGEADFDDRTLDAGLANAEARLDRALRQIAAGGAVVSFDAAVPDAERELFGAVAALNGEAGEAVSFSADGGAESAEEEGGKVSRFLHKVLERAGAITRVDTVVEGQLLASTVVGLGGDFKTQLSAVGAASDFAAHEKSLEKALRARRAWTRLVLSTVQTAVKIAAATGTGNPLLALPAAWKFIKGVMAEWKEIEQAA